MQKRSSRRTDLDFEDRKMGLNLIQAILDDLATAIEDVQVAIDFLRDIASGIELLCDVHSQL